MQALPLAAMLHISCYAMGFFHLIVTRTCLLVSTTKIRSVSVTVQQGWWFINKGRFVRLSYRIVLFVWIWHMFGRYLVYAEGHCAACRYGFMMRLGSVILKVSDHKNGFRMINSVFFNPNPAPLTDYWKTEFGERGVISENWYENTRLPLISSSWYFSGIFFFSFSQSFIDFVKEKPLSENKI